MSPFRLTPPATDPLGGEQILVSYNFEWYKFICYGLQQIEISKFWDTPPADIDEQVMTLMEMLGKPVQLLYPRSHLFLPPGATIANGNGLAWTAASGEFFGGRWFQNTAAQNDEFRFRFMANAGSWTLVTHGITASNHGRVDWYIDGVRFLQNDDYYSATTITGVEHTQGFTIDTDGAHTLAAKLATKNAASSNYFHQYQFIRLDANFS